MDYLFRAKMNIPLIQPGFVSRARIDHELNQGLTRRITQVIAPAGYGKTTAVVKWLELINLPIAWLSIDQSDNSMDSFWNYMIASLGHIMPGLEERLSLSRQSNNIPIDRIVAILIDELYKYNKDFIHVIDDYHHIQDPAIHNSLALMLKYLPDNAHFVIISRMPLPFLSTRMFMTGQIQELKLSDLQFTPEEIKAYVDSRNIPYSSRDLQSLETKTEGWAAGLYLLLSTMEHNKTSFDQLDLHINSRRIDTYLAQEVMSHWNLQDRSFFLKTSILPSLSGSLCDAVTGGTDGERQLRQFADQNSLIRILDKEKGWYRYHNLFSDFLLKQLENDTAIQKAELHNKAGDWFRDNKYHSEAINQYLQAPSYHKIADLLEEYGRELLKTGDINNLLQWLALCPEEIILQRSLLCLLYSWSLVLSDRQDEAEAWLSKLTIYIEAASGETLSSEWQRQLKAEVAAINAFIGIRHKDPRRTLEQFLLFQKQLIFDSLLLGFGVNFNIGEASLISGIFGIKGHIHIAETEYFPVYSKVRPQIKNRMGFFPILMGELAYEHNRMDEAVTQLMLGMREAEQSSSSGCFIPYYLTMARIMMSRGDINGVEEVIHNGEEKLYSKGYVHLIHYLSAFRVRLAILTDNTSAIDKWMARNCLDYLGQPSISNMYEYITLARVFLAKKDYARSMFLLSKLQLFSEQENNIYYLLEILNLKALTLHFQGQQQKSMEALYQSLMLGEANNYERIFIEEGAPMAALLERYVRSCRKAAPTEDVPSSAVSPVYVRRLIKLTRDYVIILKSYTRKSGNAGRSLTNLHRELTKREKDVLHLLDSELSYAEIAYTLDISINTVKVNCTNIYHKLAVKNREQALRSARELGIIK